MGFDYQRLRLGERVAGACAVLLFIDMFLPWYSAQITLFGITRSGSGDAWEVFAYTHLWMLLLILVTLGVIALTATQRSPALPVAGSVIVTLLAALIALLVLYRIVNQPGPNNYVSVELGAYIGFLLVAGIAAGGFLSMRDEGTSLGGARARAESMIAQRRTAGGGARTTTGSTASPPVGTAPPPEATAPPSATTPPPGEPPPPSGPANP